MKFRSQNRGEKRLKIELVAGSNAEKMSVIISRLKSRVLFNALKAFSLFNLKSY